MANKQEKTNQFRTCQVAEGKQQIGIRMFLDLTHKDGKVETRLEEDPATGLYAPHYVSPSTRAAQEERISPTTSPQFARPIPNIDAVAQMLDEKMATQAHYMAESETRK